MSPREAAGGSGWRAVPAPVLPQRCPITAGAAPTSLCAALPGPVLQRWDWSSKLDRGVGVTSPCGMVLGMWAPEPASAQGWFLLPAPTALTRPQRHWGAQPPRDLLHLVHKLNRHWSSTGSSSWGGAEGPFVAPTSPSTGRMQDWGTSADSTRLKAEVSLV